MLRKCHLPFQGRQAAAAGRRSPLGPYTRPWRAKTASHFAGAGTQLSLIHILQEAVDQHTSADTLTVVLPDRSLSFTPEVSQVALNADEAVDQAMQYGRSGGPITALITYNRAKHNEYNVDLESSLNLDTEYIRSRCV